MKCYKYMLFNIDKTDHRLSISNISETGINKDEQVVFFIYNNQKY
jgi:hypothetical protein